MSGVSTDIAPLVVVMGVSGSGKTTIGTLVAHELGVDFIDGDSLHPIENVQKMAPGTPRRPVALARDRGPHTARAG